MTTPKLDLIDHIRELTERHANREHANRGTIDETARCVNTSRSLTHSSELSREGLAVKATCSIDGCDRPHKARGYCHTHYTRWLRTGTTSEDQSVQVHDSNRGCVIAACDREHYGRGWCKGHYDQWVRLGEPKNAPITRPLSETYNAVHWRIVARRGKASAQTCVDCGCPAAHWAYNHSGIDEVEGPRFTPIGSPMMLCYSIDLQQYDPRCIDCHRTFDKAHHHGGQA